MKKKLILMCTAGVLVMTAVIGGTLAGFNTSAGKGVSDITVKQLGIEMQGTSSENIAQDSLNGIVAVPGGEVGVTHSIVNNVEGGSDGYKLYTRVTIDKKWNKDNLDPSKIHLYAGTTELKTKENEIVNVNDWIVWYADDEQVIMYYTLPLEYKAETTNLIDKIKFDADLDNSYAGAEVKLEFTADAVQAIAAADSIPSEWGVYPTIDADGKISAIEE